MPCSAWAAPSTPRVRTVVARTGTIRGGGSRRGRHRQRPVRCRPLRTQVRRVWTASLPPPEPTASWICCVATREGSRLGGSIVNPPPGARSRWIQARRRHSKGVREMVYRWWLFRRLKRDLRAVLLAEAKFLVADGRLTPGCEADVVKWVLRRSVYGRSPGQVLKFASSASYTPWLLTAASFDPSHLTEAEKAEQAKFEQKWTAERAARRQEEKEQQAVQQERELAAEAQLDPKDAARLAIRRSLEDSAKRMGEYGYHPRNRDS
jgi:hypothetical protein